MYYFWLTNMISNKCHTMTFFYVCKEQKLNMEFVNCKILKLMNSNLMINCNKILALLSTFCTMKC
jgi:hypothetical protein